VNTHIAAADREQPRSQREHTWLLVGLAWGVTLLVSILPDIVLREVVHKPADGLMWGKIGVTSFFVVGTLVWKPMRPLRGFFLVLLVLHTAGWVIGLIANTDLWQSWFRGTAFSTTMFEVQIQKLLSAVVMIAALLVIKRRPNTFFLTAGDIHAPAEPVRWLGIERPISWSRLGPISAVCISLGVLVFLLLSGVPSLDSIGSVLPLLPVILLFASMNAFSETMSFRAPMLATLHEVVGKQHTLILTAAYFGIAHFYGVPYGLVGVVMAGVLGWFLGKAMLETRGLVWPWFIHFCQDALIFTFIAIGSVVPGG
jgi:hypothetical protein